MKLYITKQAYLKVKQPIQCTYVIYSFILIVKAFPLLHALR